MSDTDPLAPVLGAKDPRDRPPRTIGGGQRPAALFGFILLGVQSPLATLTTATVAVASVLVAGLSRQLRRRRRLCVPGTNRCMDLP
jgi:hypothetical protein